MNILEVPTFFKAWNRWFHRLEPLVSQCGTDGSKARNQLTNCRMDMKQLIHLIGRHRFYAAACMIGTAVTLAFVMVMVMVYDFRTADVALRYGRRAGVGHRAGCRLAVPSRAVRGGAAGLLGV